ncbi:MAG: twitching motility protein PilT [Clostridiaceae bacterium]|nr:twitching motility protein PilT [Eubacteriales bacterium]
MIRVIVGETGTGKTKRIISMANETLQSAKGSIVFLDHDSKYMFDLKNAIRFIDASEFHIDCPEKFTGFLAGLAAQDFDLEYIFIDGFRKIVRHPLETLPGLFEELEAFSKERGVKIIFSISANPETLPEFLRGYFLEMSENLV